MTLEAPHHERTVKIQSAKELALEIEILDLLKTNNISLGANMVQTLEVLHERAKKPVDSQNTNMLNRADLMNMRALLRDLDYLDVNLRKSFVKEICLQYIGDKPRIDFEILSHRLLNHANAKLAHDSSVRADSLKPLVALIGAHSANFDYHILGELIDIAHDRMHELWPIVSFAQSDEVMYRRRGASIDFHTLSAISTSQEDKARRLVERASSYENSFRLNEVEINSDKPRAVPLNKLDYLELLSTVFSSFGMQGVEVKNEVNGFDVELVVYYQTPLIFLPQSRQN